MIKREFGQGNEYVSPSGNTYFFVFENFSFLQNSDMSVTVLVDIWNQGCCVIKLVVSGGKQGLFRLDIFGREGSRLSNVQQGFQRIASMNNWQIVPFTPGPPAPQ